MAKNFRLYIKESLAPEKIVILDEAQSHYLKNVVKMSSQDTVSCFDGQNGEFSTSILNIGKKNITLKIADKIKPFYACPDIWLLFAPLKKDCTDFVIEKATELGCRRILPVITEHTNTINIKIDRYLAQSIEAAEQCRRTDIPEIAAPQTLDTLLTNWDAQRTLFYMDETLKSPSFYTVLQNNQTNKAAVLIGPEGGFSPHELAALHNTSFARGATLGPRILRAETAALAALSCWQLISGDWSK